MIELDQTNPDYIAEFEHLKSPPTHAEMILCKFCIPKEEMEDSLEGGYRVMLRKHIEAVYVFGRLNENNEFIQTKSDLRVKPVHTAIDTHQYETEPRYGPNGIEGGVTDSPERQALQEQWKRLHAIRDTLLAEGEGPHPEDPTKRIPRVGKKKNRFDEQDLDIAVAHTEYRLRGKAC